MNLASGFRLVLPPLFYAVARRLRDRTWKSATFSAATFSPRVSFASASLEAGRGYSDHAVLAKHRPGPSMTDLPDYIGPMLASFAIASRGGDPIRICDFGGNSGYFHSYVQLFFGSNLADWRVVETPEQVEFCADANIPGLSFSTSIGREPYDLAIFSGVMQYLSDWTAPFREIDAEYIFIARSPIDNIERPFIQTFTRDGDCFQLAGRVIRKSDLFDLLSETHDLFASWALDSHLMEMGSFPSPAMLWRRKSVIGRVT